MESFYSRYRNVLMLVGVLLAQVIGLAVQVRRPATTAGQDTHQVRLIRYWVVDILTPFEETFLFVGHGIRGAWHGYIDLRHVYHHNQVLQGEIDRLRLEQSSLSEDARQGQRLQALLNFKQQYLYQTVAAQVIGTSGTDQSRVLYIDKGSEDGLQPDMPVVTPDGVVGKIRDVFGHTSQVLEINDQTNGLGIILEQTRLRGILRGDAIGQIEIVNIPPDEHIQTGEAVITSGGDQIYPRGLLVGTVDRVVNDPERAPYVAVLVRPAAKLSRLEEVLVITKIGSTLPATEEADIITSEQKAADILAQRLPGADDGPAQTVIGPNGRPLPAQDPSAPPPPVQPPLSLYPDRFTPDATPPATSLRPGAPYSKEMFPAQPATPAPAQPLPTHSRRLGIKTAAPKITAPLATPGTQPATQPTAPATPPPVTPPAATPAPAAQPASPEPAAAQPAATSPAATSPTATSQEPHP